MGKSLKAVWTSDAPAHEVAEEISGRKIAGGAGLDEFDGNGRTVCSWAWGRGCIQDENGRTIAVMERRDGRLLIFEC